MMVFRLPQQLGVISTGPRTGAGWRGRRVHPVNGGTLGACGIFNAISSG